MIKRHALDIAVIIIAMLIAVGLAEAPDMKTDDSRVAAPPAKAPPGGTATSEKRTERNNGTDDQRIIKERNIFATSGVYVEPTGQVLSENPYVLIAFLQGNEKRAVFRDQTGNVVALPVGKVLTDGFVITRIDSVSVQLQRRESKKELRLFNMGGGTAPPAIDKGGIVPKNLYTLIGIFGDHEKKAAFKDYRGAVSILGVGSKLLDGRVITAIDAAAVKLQKGNEKSELRVFDIQRSEESMRK